MKKSKPRKATIMTPVKQLSRKDTIEHYNAVLLEDIRSKMELVIEKANSSEERLTAKIDDLRTENNTRFDTIEGVLKQHTKILNEHTQKLDGHDKRFTYIETAVTEHTQILKEHGRKLENLESDVGVLKSDIIEVKSSIKRLDEKVEHLDEKVSCHDTKLASIDSSIKHLDAKVSDKLDDHEQRIVTLEKTAILP